MASFDIYLRKIADYMEEMRGRHRQITEMNCSADGLPVRVGIGAQQGVILKEDTYVELGSPSTASSALLLWVEDPSLIRDERVTLIGPDINESAGKSLPFGQVLILGGAGLKEEHQATLEWTQYVSDRIEGYMIRTVPQRIWSRVTKEAVGKGFCFGTLGRALVQIFKSELPLIEAMEILFVTSSKEDVQELEGIAMQVEKITREIKRRIFSIADDGVYECTSGVDCVACSDQAICDSIREVIKLRKADVRNALAQ